ncbi:unnamed protein product, partial [Ectocarpus sp. 12 AP-2014]
AQGIGSVPGGLLVHVPMAVPCTLDADGMSTSTGSFTRFRRASWTAVSRRGGSRYCSYHAEIHGHKCAFWIHSQTPCANNHLPG